MFKPAALVLAVWALSVPTSFALQDIRGLLRPFVPQGGPDQNTSNYYLGYRGADYNTRWAKYFNDSPIPLSQEFSAGIARSPVDRSLGVSIKDAPAALNKPGYLPLENGFTILRDGTMYLAIRTDVPADFSGEAYDFWFSWHLNDTTKYKLWYPGAHQYAAVSAKDLAGDASKPSYRQRYYNATSWVDEYIGSTAYKLSIGFFDPALMGFSTDVPATGVETIVTAFIQLFSYSDLNPSAQAKLGFGPLNVALAHQVRRKPDGSGYEIRSRFWFGGLLVTGMRVIMDPYDLARDLGTHCAREMSHLGTFLPALFQEFRNDVPTGGTT